MSIYIYIIHMHIYTDSIRLGDRLGREKKCNFRSRPDEKKKRTFFRLEFISRAVVTGSYCLINILLESKAPLRAQI